MMNLKVKDFRMQSHWNMDKEGVLIYAGTIDNPTHILHGKSIARITRTPKKRGVWGKGVTVFCLGDDKSPEFLSIDEFMKHYNLPDQTEEITKANIEAIKADEEENNKKVKPINPTIHAK